MDARKTLKLYQIYDGGVGRYSVLEADVGNLPDVDKRYRVVFSVLFYGLKVFNLDGVFCQQELEICLM